MGKCDEFFGNLMVTINYLKSDLIKKQRSFKIGLISIFMIVFFLTLLLNAIQLCPCIFIKLSEEQSGEIDLILTPYIASRNVESKKSGFDTFFYNKTSQQEQNASIFDLSQLNFLNFYDIKRKLSDLSFIEGVSPRWIITGKASNKNEMTNNYSEFSANIFILDSAEENNMGIGRELNLPELQKNECYVSTTLGDALKLKNGDSIQMEIRLSDLLNAFSGEGDVPEDEEDEENPFGPDQVKSSNNQGNNRVNNQQTNFKPINNININNIGNEFNSLNKSNNSFYENINNIGENAFNNNKFINKIKSFLNIKQIKNLLNSFLNDYINKNIDENKKKLLNIINKYFSNNNGENDASVFSIKKSYLMNSFLNDEPYIKELLNILSKNFGQNNNDDDFNNNEYEKSSMDKIIMNAIVKQIFTYNEKTDLITLDQNIFNFLSSDNLLNSININLDNIFDQFSQLPTLDNLTQFLNFELNLTVREQVKATGGKWPSASGNVLALDSRHIKDYLYLNVERIIDEIITAFHLEIFRDYVWNLVENYLKDFDINNYALTINAIFKDKFEIYKKDQKTMRHYISNIASDITTLLGSNYQVNIQLPIYLIMAGVEVAKIFLQDIFIGIMFFLWTLCVLLVYSLMLGNVDERTYEFGMLRSLGFKKNNLTLLIIIQGFIFAIPGTILGLITAYIANNYVAFLFNWYTNLVMPYFLSTSNLIFGIIAGLSIPIVSSYFPIKKCLDDNLRETLAIFNKKIGDIVVSMIKLENLGVSPTTLIAAITLIIIGLLTYYVAPLSFLLLNSSLFLFIMIGILITMLLGLIILTQLLVPYLQKFILKIIMFLSFKDRNLHLIVIKNLEGHKRRDQQVSIMFMVALGFVIFAGCTLNLVVDFVETIAKSLIGGDFSIYITNQNGQNITFNEIAINNYLQSMKQNYPDLIQNYGYISWSSNDLLYDENVVLKSRISPLSGYPIIRRRVYGIDRNFIDSTYTSLYSISQYDKKINKSYTYDKKIDIIKMMYDNPNIPYLLKGQGNDSFIFPTNENKRLLKILGDFQMNMIAAEGIRKSQAISVENPAKLSFNFFIPHSFPCKIVGMANKLPGILTYSSYNSIAMYSEVYIPMEQMKKLIDIESEIYNTNFGNVSNVTLDGVRKRQFILKYKDKVTKDLREMLYFSMNNYLGTLSCFSIQLDDVIEISEKVKRVIGYIFLVLGIIALILSFFLIWTSFYSNIRENITEYGIMRSIGITKAQSIRIYLYEAATIILTSIIIGTFIGVVISSSLILQFDIFIELPFIFNFPYQLYFILISVGLFLGLLGSYYPTYAVNSLSLVKIMKGFNE